MSEYIEYDDVTPRQSARHFNNDSERVRSSTNQQQQNPRASHMTATSGGIRDSKVVYSDMLDNINSMRHRQSLLEGLRGSGAGGGGSGMISDLTAPPPAMMFKPGSADENASGITKVFKRLASTWKKRRVSMNTKAFIYDDPDTKKMVGAVKIEDITQAKMINRQAMKESGCPENLRDFGWFLMGGGRQYVFACEDARTRDVWVGFLTALIKQRNNDEQYLGDEAALTDGRSTSFGNGGNSPSGANTRGNGGGAGGQGSIAPVNATNKFQLPAAATSTSANGQESPDYLLSPETLQAQEAAFDSVRNLKVQQYMKKKNSDGNSGDGGGGSRKNDDDDDDREEESAPSGDSDFVVERGAEVVAATIEKTKEKRQAIIEVPGPNVAYRRENVVIEALFEDLRTQEPDHVRLAFVENPDCALSYFQPQLLRAAQDNDLPADLPPKPLLVADCYDNCDQIWPPLRNDSLLPVSRIKKLAVELERMEVLQKAPAFKGMNCVVVDAEGLFVGGSSNISIDSSKGSNSLMDFARQIQVRHAAARCFDAVWDLFIHRTNLNSHLGGTNTVVDDGSPNSNPNNNNNNNLNNNASFVDPQQYISQYNNNRSFGLLGVAGSAGTLNNASMIRNYINNGVTTSAAGSPLVVNNRSVAFPDAPSASAATTTADHQKQQQQQQPAVTNGTFASTRPPHSPTKPNTKGPTHMNDGTESGYDIIEETKSLKNADSSSNNAAAAEKQQRTLGRLFTQSVAVFRNFGGGGADAKAAREQIQALMNSSESVINQYLPAGARQMVYGRDGKSACPSAHGPVIVIETTKRKMTVTDAAYRSDVLHSQGHNKRPPLFMITTEDLLAPAK